MKLTARALLPLLPLITACRLDVQLDGDGDGTNSNDGTTSDSASTTGDTNSDTGTTTGLEDYCGLSPDNPEMPWFELRDRGELLDDSHTLYLECGGQGAFMFEIEPTVGGVIPEGDYLPFHVELDVEGFNLGPSGHFATSDIELFVACCPYEEEYYCFYETYTLRLFPPDQIMDLSVLDQLPATLTVTLTGPGEPLEQVVDVTLWAVDDGSWEWCSYSYGYGVVPDPLPIGGSIPEPAEP